MIVHDYYRMALAYDVINTTYTLRCLQEVYELSKYVSTAIITMEGEWTNRTTDTLDCVFALPTPGTIMNVTLHIGEDRLLRTAIIPNKYKFQSILIIIYFLVIYQCTVKR